MENVKQFNYDEWMNHPRKDEIEIINGMGLRCTGLTDALKHLLKPGYSLVGYFKEASILSAYTLDGRIRADLPHGAMLSDLYMVMPPFSSKKEIWIIVYHSDSRKEYLSLVVDSADLLQDKIAGVLSEGHRIISVQKLEDSQ